MKTTKKLIPVILSLGFLFFFNACQKDEETVPEETSGIVPETFKVDIPDAISQAVVKSVKSAASDDTLNGDELYENMSTFIYVGESAADIVRDIINAIRRYNLNKAMTFNFTGEDDGREKKCVITEGASYEGKSWEFRMDISDIASESEEDKGMGLQIFWNRNPVEGYAIIKPYNVDRTNQSKEADAMYKIYYSENGQNGYEQQMIVYIDLKTINPDNPYAIKTLKMFAGKKGDVIEVFGNSDHPQAKFFTDETGFNWAFVAAGDDKLNIGVAEVGLPPSNLDESSRDVLLNDYSLKNVLTDQINEWFMDQWSVKPDSADLANYLKNCDAPGYFEDKGFVQGGVSPGTEYDELAGKIEYLTPYNPKEIGEQQISFQK